MARRTGERARAPAQQGRSRWEPAEGVAVTAEKNLRKFRPGREAGKRGAWKPEKAFRPDSGSLRVVVSRKVTTPPPTTLLHWKDIIAAAWRVGGAGWTQRDMNTVRPSGTGQVGGCPSRWSKATTCGLGFPVSINSLHLRHSLSSCTSPPDMGVGEEPLVSAVTASGK